MSKTNRARLQELARVAGIADGFDHMVECGTYVVHRDIPGIVIDAVLRQERDDRHVSTHKLALVCGAFMHGKTMQFAYDLGFHYGQRRARQGIVYDYLAVRTLSHAARDQAKERTRGK
jgi:uncharacterized membrane protein